MLDHEGLDVRRSGVPHTSIGDTGASRLADLQGLITLLSLVWIGLFIGVASLPTGLTPPGWPDYLALAGCFAVGIAMRYILWEHLRRDTFDAVICTAIFLFSVVVFAFGGVNSFLFPFFSVILIFFGSFRSRSTARTSALATLTGVSLILSLSAPMTSSALARLAFFVLAFLIQFVTVYAAARHVETIGRYAGERVPAVARPTWPAPHVIADDHDRLRPVTLGTLFANGDPEIAGEAGNGAGAVHRYARILPSPVPTDLEMLEIDGRLATRVITRVRYLTATDGDEQATVVPM